MAGEEFLLDFLSFWDLTGIVKVLLELIFCFGEEIKGCFVILDLLGAATELMSLGAGELKLLCAPVFFDVR